jgi:AraC family transcriptional regulator
MSMHELAHPSAVSLVPIPRVQLPSRRLNTVIDYMKAHLDRPLAVSELAELPGSSPTHFSRAFREAVGKPPHACLIDLRLKKARVLPEYTRLSITEIALSCGFEHSQYFAIAFRKKLGLTPRSGRRRADAC